MEVIPAIDLLGGECVRLYQGDFARVTRYEKDPLTLAARYRAAGLRRLHVVDLDGARDGRPVNHATIARLARESGLLVQAGGGVRTWESLEALLDAGVCRVVLGSIAVKDPATTRRWIREAGAERIVLGFDVRLDPGSGVPRALVHGWKDEVPQSLWELLDDYASSGVRDVLCTDVGRDGTLAGPNTALYAACARRHPELRFIASGGLGSAADLPALAANGAAAVVAGKALLDGRITLEEIRAFSPAA
jgi:phosphoribosylformimino-5-aminoimidazole carboxamide ribotide isomerase